MLMNAWPKESISKLNLDTIFLGSLHNEYLINLLINAHTHLKLLTTISFKKLPCRLGYRLLATQQCYDKILG